MLSFSEMIYVFAIATVCFLSCVFKTALMIRGTYSEVVSMYIFLTFTLFLCSFLMFMTLRKKCREYENNRKKEVFLAAKKLKNISEMILLTVLIFLFTSLYDLFNANYIGKIFLDISALFKSYPFYEALLGIASLIFGFKVILYFYEINKLYSAMEFENLKKVPKSVYDVMKQYPTFEEYEKGITSGGTLPAKKAYPSANQDQERFLKENEVPIDSIEKRLVGLDGRRMKNGRPVYSKFDYATAPSADNSLVACPFCGSLNTKGSGECSFCGADMNGR